MQSRFLLLPWHLKTISLLETTEESDTKVNSRNTVYGGWKSVEFRTMLQKWKTWLSFLLKFLAHIPFKDSLFYTDKSCRNWRLQQKNMYYISEVLILHHESSFCVNYNSVKMCQTSHFYFNLIYIHIVHKKQDCTILQNLFYSYINADPTNPL